jgi:hypothetical protein
LPRFAAARIGPHFHAETDSDHLSAGHPFGFCHGPLTGALDLGAEARTAAECGARALQLLFANGVQQVQKLAAESLAAWWQGASRRS